MSTPINNLVEEKKNNLISSLHSKRASWNSKRKYNYKYIRSVF